MRIPLPLVDFAYKLSDSAISAQECVNLFPETVRKGKSPVVLRGTPGTKAYAQCSGSVRGMYVFDNALYVVSGADLWKITGSGSSVLISSGGIPGEKPVSMAGNDAGQLVIVAPDTGAGFIFSGGILSSISDPDFRLATSVAYLDGFFVFSEKNSARIFISALRDGSSYDSLDFATAEALPDDLYKIVAKNRELWLFGSDSVEIWHNTGDTFPFSRVPGAVIENGAVNSYCISSVDNVLFWLSPDGRVYLSDGYSARVISDRAIEQEISGYNLSASYSFAYKQEGHVFYVLTFTGNSKTFCFDLVSGGWHERRSNGGAHFATSSAIYGARVLVGSPSGAVLRYSLDAYTENGGNYIERVRSCSPVSAENNAIAIYSLQVDIATGKDVSQNLSPEVMLSWSDDGGNTFSNERISPLGKVGQYLHRSIWRGLGQSRNRTFKIRITDPVRVTIIDAQIDAEVRV